MTTHTINGLVMETRTIRVGEGPAAGPRPLVIGLDVALGITGVAGPGWADHIRAGTRRGEVRLGYILEACASFYRHADYVLIEGPAFGQARQVGHDEMSAIRWMIRCDLLKRNIPCAVVNPNHRTIYATGKARHKGAETGAMLTAKQVKGLVRDAAEQRYGVQFEGTARYDEADAYVLMAMGMDWLGHPLAQVPSTHARAVGLVPWPEAVAR